MINGSYGLLNEYNSPIYYPQGAMQVTITGQLYLLYLLELLDQKLSELLIIQANTINRWCCKIPLIAGNS